jgi:hypothetical protein
MWTGIVKAAGLATVVALVALGLGACGSGDKDVTKPPKPPLSIATADQLAKLSDRVASQLQDGDTCHAAHTADDLRTALDDADLPPTIRPGVQTVADNLVNQVNCPPPPPPPEEKKEQKEPKPPGEDHGNHHGDQQGGHGPSPGHGGIPPGQAKLKGEGGD